MERSDIVSFLGIYSHGDTGHCPIPRYLHSLRDRTLSHSQVFILRDIWHYPILRYLHSWRYWTLSYPPVFSLNERSDTVLSSGIYSQWDIGHWPILGNFLLFKIKDWSIWMYRIDCTHISLSNITNFIV